MAQFADRAMVFLLTIAGLCLPAASQQDSTPPPPDSHRAPAVQDSQANRPVSPAKVKCDGNLLTISASNATLASILAEVRKCSGAQIDVPDSAASTKVFDELGPGPARQVLDQLLSDNGFNYVIGSSLADPDKIESILLMPRSADSSASLADPHNLTPMRRAFAQMRENARPKPPAENDPGAAAVQPDSQPAESSTTAPADNAPATSSPTTSDNGPKPAETAANAPTPDVPAPPDPPAAKAARAPADITQDKITNMEQMFEQRRQMLQQPRAPSQPQ